jgi:threonine/homoserine/homoserine lactone efflux protein
MTLQTVITFAAVATLAIVSPGPAALLSLRNGATLGPRSVVWSALGNISGVACLSAAAMLGLGVILKSSTLVFSTVKIAGACYLFYVGVRHLLGRAVVTPAPDAQASVQLVAPPASLYREGFLIAATNPKAVLFFTALFPQFIDANTAIIPQFLLLTGIFMAISYASHLGYAMIASRARGMLAKPFFATWLNRIVGAAFVAFGSLLLALRRQSV